MRELRNNEVANAATAGGAASSAATLSTYVCRLEVAVQDVVVVHRLHAEAHLDEEGPDGRLGQVPRATLGLEQLQQVALTGELGHNVEDVLLDESLVECDHMLTRNGGEDANLVDGLGALLGRHLTRVNLLDRVDFAVNLSSRLVHGAKGPLTEEFEQLKAIDLAKRPTRGRHHRHCTSADCTRRKSGHNASAEFYGIGAGAGSQHRLAAVLRKSLPRRRWCMGGSTMPEPDFSSN